MKGNQSNGFLPIIAQAIAEMEETFGEFFSFDRGVVVVRLRTVLPDNARSRFWMGILLYWIVSCAAASAIPLSVWNVCIA